MNIFIPFIEPYISETFIENVFDNQNFGKVTSIQLHDKKIKTKSNLKNQLKSAKHNYAFITITLYNSVQGKNMRDNLLYNKTTHVMFNYKEKLQHLQVKPHLTVEDRLERGFELHISNKDICEKITVNNKKTTIEQDEQPEWFNNITSNLFSFDFKNNIKKTTLALLIPDIDLTNLLCKGQMAPRVRKKSFYNNMEKIELDKDYCDTMNDIEIERLNFQHYVSLMV